MEPNQELDNHLLQQEDDSLNIGDMIRIVRAHWLWFVLSIIVCLAIAFVYLKWAPKQYTRTATVLIKDEKKGAGAISESSAFSDIGMFSMRSSVDNEVLLFQSKLLMQNVVKRLNLDIRYTVKRGLRTTDLYTQSPVVLVFPESESNQKFSLTVTPIDETHVKLSDFEAEGIDISETKTVVMGDTIQTLVGKLMVSPSFYYTGEYIGKTIRVQKKDCDEVALRFNRNLQVSLASKTTSIINLTLQDVSIPRAEDVVNTVISVYNEDAVNDKSYYDKHLGFY